MSVFPENDNQVIDYVAFAFVYGYNENTMTVHSATLNISSTSYSVSDSSDTTDNETSDTTEEDNYIDYEVLSETLDTTQTYMETSSVYDNTGSYVTAETDEAGNTVTYTYDVNGNVTSVTDGNENVINCTYDVGGNVTQIKSYDAQNDYSYNGAGLISAIDHNNFRYQFNYNVYNSLISTAIGDNVIATNTYNNYNGLLKKTTYANGDYIEYLYDVYDNLLRIVGENGVIVTFTYNKKGLVSKVNDYQNALTTYYYYDFNGSVTGEYRQSDEGQLSYYLSYDSDGNKVEKTSINGHVKTITRGSDENSTYVNNDGITVSALSDNFGRTTQVLTSRGEDQAVYFSSYEYANGNVANSTTNLVSELTQTYANNELVNYEYSYDNNGNIVNIRVNGVETAKFAYDELNQLVTSADRNSELYTFFYYDNAGNITSVKEYTLNTTSWVPISLVSEKSYTYGDTNWKDKLTSYNGTTITYDEMGNPLSYRNGISFTWINGRILDSINSSEDTIYMKYDSNGMRMQKYDSEHTTNYYYDSKNNLIGLDKAGSTLFFYYDNNGTPTAFKNNGIMYYYVKNLQGDVIKILKQDGTVAATYTYDAWGKILSVKDGSNVDVPSSNGFHVANLNPYRYRGYLYDMETGLYYLQTRYYDPVVGRFLNADDMQFIIQYSVLSVNLYTYCRNNSVTNIDIRGTSSNYNYTMISPPTELLGEGFKTLVAMAASVYLDSKGYTISKIMFLHSLYGGGDGLPPEVIEKIIYLLQKNDDFMDTAEMVANNSKGYGWITDKNGEDGYEFTEGDLYYSFQHATVFVNRVFYNGMKGIRIILSDTYDFDRFRLISDGINFGNAANDLGRTLQLKNMLTTYDVEVSFTYYYKKE